MSGRVKLGSNVFNTAVERLVTLYEQGHRPVVSFSAGKDSGVCLELAIIAARLAGRLPVDVVMRDEEIMYPGTFEYAERVAERPEVRFRWVIANQPIVNVFNRREPYWWVFDPLVPPEKWVRQPPAIAEHIPHQNIAQMVVPERFPPDDGARLMAVIGLRVQESLGRLYGLFSSGGYVTKPNEYGVSNVRPIYDWTDGDVWRAYHEFGWDYNRAYDTMHKMGVPARRLRIAPPTLNQAAADGLQVASRAWPRWFDAVCDRLPGVRAVVLFGKRAAEPYRKQGETWKGLFEREVLGDEAPEWIRERAETFLKSLLRAHGRHATTELPEVEACIHCFKDAGSWRSLVRALYNGDPFSLKTGLPYIEPEFFRPGAGTWGGKPTW